ncbi:hypothetical protein Mpsy_1668 [Methanolobus psychrophilus R15]|nr:hypothetical protein Mpsy_1668 [Methanolobus psychrophilus R15]
MIRPALFSCIVFQGSFVVLATTNLQFYHFVIADLIKGQAKKVHLRQF